MRVIYKYPFAPYQTYLTAPAGDVRLVAEQHGNTMPTIWIEHGDPTEPLDMALYFIVGTGHAFEPGPGETYQHVGSAICGPFVWHVYRVVKS